MIPDDANKDIGIDSLKTAENGFQSDMCRSIMSLERIRQDQWMWMFIVPDNDNAHEKWGTISRHVSDIPGSKAIGVVIFCET
jgi:hypothetical protein